MVTENLAQDVKEILGSKGDAYATQCRVWVSIGTWYVPFTCLEARDLLKDPKTLVENIRKKMKLWSKRRPSG